MGEDPGRSLAIIFDNRNLINLEGRGLCVNTLSLYRHFRYHFTFAIVTLRRSGWWSTQRPTKPRGR